MMAAFVLDFFNMSEDSLPLERQDHTNMDSSALVLVSAGCTMMVRTRQHFRKPLRSRDEWPEHPNRFDR
jgi:hypothetical protein